jgi:hypothetical protein
VELLHTGSSGKFKRSSVASQTGQPGKGGELNQLTLYLQPVLINKITCICTFWSNFFRSSSKQDGFFPGSIPPPLFCGSNFKMDRRKSSMYVANGRQRLFGLGILVEYMTRSPLCSIKMWVSCLRLTKLCLKTKMGLFLIKRFEQSLTNSH